MQNGLAANKEDRVFLGVSRGICRTCRDDCEVRTIADSSGVYLEGICPEHGKSRAQVAETLAWYLRAMQAPALGRPPDRIVLPRTEPCARSCGPCTFHAQRCHLPVFSITNACELRCPICFTYNRADRLYFMTQEELDRQLDFVLASTGTVDLINLTGGEPTQHPKLFDLLARAQRPGIGRVTMNTNGLCLARDPEMARRLADLGVYVILSLDTLRSEVSCKIHGRDICDDKKRALEHLERYEVPTTILTVLIGDVNESDLEPIVDLSMKADFVRSLTIQTMAYTGQGGGAFLPRRHICVEGAERRLATASGGRVKISDFMPLPTAHPLCYGVAYYLVGEQGALHALLDFTEPASLARWLADGYLLHPNEEMDETIRRSVERLWAEGGHDALLSSMKRMLATVYPSGQVLSVHERQARAERMTKTIYVHAHMDEDTFEIGRAMRCPDQVPVNAEKLIGACSYNLFYRQQDERFWGEAMSDACLEATRALCNVCGRLVDAKLVAREGRVFLVKWCRDHGETAALVCSDLGWHIRSLAYVKPRATPRSRAVTRYVGCPSSCGLCSEHEQHTCVPILEITGACDLDCPICIVGDNLSGHVPLNQVKAMIDMLVEREGQINMLTLSGGEPCSHPDLLAIIDAARRSEIGIVSLSTNGLRLEGDPRLLDALCDRGVVISLQMDGFDPKTYQALRGNGALAERKVRLLESLLERRARISLTMTLARGVNEHEVPAVLDRLFECDTIVSLMVQPLAYAGRAAARMPDNPLDVLTIFDVVQLLATGSRGRLQISDFTPLPCSHPSCFCLTYVLCTEGGGFTPLSRILPEEIYLDLIKNQALLNTDTDSLARARDAVYTLWSSSAMVPNREAVLGTLKRLLLDLNRLGRKPSHAEVLDVGVRNIKSIFIHQFMDRRTFDLSRAIKCCNHYPQIDGRLLPACIRNVGLSNLPNQGT